MTVEDVVTLINSVNTISKSLSMGDTLLEFKARQHNDLELDSENYLVRIILSICGTAWLNHRPSGVLHFTAMAGQISHRL